jgi:hypothetical protein
MLTAKKLIKFKQFYKGSEKLGSARILRNYLELDNENVVPLSISHGVDMNHTDGAMDVNDPAPIHWSTNKTIHERAQRDKQSITLPHPWLMLISNKEYNVGKGVLIIGPPPGRNNDLRLLSCMKNQGVPLIGSKILIKKRGEVNSSIDFWKSNGLEAVSAGEGDEYFYDRLFNILQEFEYIFSCTLSSAVFFASAIGKKCIFINNYFYECYDLLNYCEKINISSVQKNLVTLIDANEYEKAKIYVLKILGSEYCISKSILRLNLESEIDKIIDPVFTKIKNPFILRQMYITMCNLIKKNGLITYGARAVFLRILLKNMIVLVRRDELDTIRNGVNFNNYNYKKIRYVKGKTEPGMGAN